MLDELGAATTAAEELADAVRTRLDAGDPADDLMGRLAAATAEVVRLATGADLSDADRAGLDRLLARVRSAAAVGDDWLSRTSEADGRVRRAYGLPPRL